MGDFAGICGLHRRRGNHRVNLFGVDAAREVLVLSKLDALDGRVAGIPCPLRLAEELHRLVCVDRENGLQVNSKDAERVERSREDDTRRLRVGLHRLPRLPAVEILVRRVSEPTDLDDRQVEAAVLVVARNRLSAVAELLQKRQLLVVPGKRGELAVELLLEHLRGARGDVRDLADEIGVDALDEVREIQVHVVGRAAELRGVVVPERLGREMVEVCPRVDERALRLRHLLAVDGEKAVDEYLVRLLEAGDVQHPRPEEAVEADYVLADKMIMLNLGQGFGGARTPGCCPPPVLELLAVLLAPVAERGEVADRRVDPDVEELVLVAGNLEAEVRRVARDAPAAQGLLEPLEELVRDVARRVARNPLLEEVVLRLELEV